MRLAIFSGKPLLVSVRRRSGMLWPLCLMCPQRRATGFLNNAAWLRHGTFTGHGADFRKIIWLYLSNSCIFILKAMAWITRPHTNFWAFTLDYLLFKSYIANSYSR
jgi:hypothetical protein